MFDLKRKTFCQVLVQHIDGDILVMKRFDDLELYPGKYEIAVTGEVKVNEQPDEYVKRIVQDQTGMKCESFEKVYEDICLGDLSRKKCFVCIVKDKKEALQMSIPEIESIEWLSRHEWKGLLESGKIMRNQRISYHDFFHNKGLVPKYYVDENDIYEYYFEEMESDARANVDMCGAHVKSVYAWYDKEIDGVQLYIWHTELPEGYLHYIINETSIWTEEEEAYFDFYMREGVICEGIDASAIFRIYMNKYPYLNLSYLKNYSPKKLLEELYYFLRGGVKKILFENELGKLAQSLDELKIEYKKDGKTPSEILFDIDYEVLYAINSYRGATLLTDVEMIKALKLFYQEVPEFFCERLTDSRLFDLESILESKYISYNNNMVFDARDKELYQKYLENREKLTNITRNLPIRPLKKSFWRFYSKAQLMLGFLQHENEINEELKKIYEELILKYTYEDKNYKISIPKSLREYIQGSEEMFHDYWKFIEFIIRKQTCILLLLDKKKNDVPIAVIEVSDNNIIDVRGKYNMDVREDITAWVNNYAKEKKINYRKFENEDDLPLPFD